MRDDEVFELSEEDLPLTIHIYDKDGVEVDAIDVDGPGVLELPDYPIEGRPYSVRIERPEPKKNLVQKAYMHQGWARK